MTMNTVDTAMDAPLSLDGFVRESRERAFGADRFVNESPRTVRVDVADAVWLKPGAAIAYRGQITFERLPTIGAPSLKDALLREAAPLVRARGLGRLYCGQRGAEARVIRLNGESIVVSWNDLLAFEDALTFETMLLTRGVGMAAGGLVGVRLGGHGAFAIATHGQPLTLAVAPGRAVCTDPRSTVAWSANLAPALKTDLNWRSALGHGGQQPFQMRFDGNGFVVVQPYRDASRVKLPTPRLRRFMSSLAAAVLG